MLYIQTSEATNSQNYLMEILASNNNLHSMGMPIFCGFVAVYEACTFFGDNYFICATATSLVAFYTDKIYYSKQYAGPYIK